MSNVDPFLWFADWLAQANACDAIKEPTAMALSTCADNHPNVRMVLLKDFDASGFVFYTNTQSQKGRELAANPEAALLFYWMPLERQVRIRGRVEPVSAAEADAYFATRGHGKQIGAWASEQSRPLSSRAALMARAAELEITHAGKSIPRPPHWSGYRVVPDEIEFWSQGDFRLHDRILYTRAGTGWTTTRLNP